MKFDNDSNIVIRGGEHEHHANYFPWLKLGKKVDVRSVPIDENGGFSDSNFKKSLDEKTKLVALSHGLYNSGLILPVKEIGKELQKENIPYFWIRHKLSDVSGNLILQIQDVTLCHLMDLNGCVDLWVQVYFIVNENQVIYLNLKTLEESLQIQMMMV